MSTSTPVVEKAGADQSESPLHDNNADNDWQVQRDQEKGYGDNAFRARDFATAIYHYTAALSIDPTNHILLSNRSAAHLSAQQKSKALHDAQACVQHMPPDYAKGYSRLAAALHSLGRYEQAKEAWEKLLKIEPNNAVAKKGLDDAVQVIQTQQQQQHEENVHEDDYANGSVAGGNQTYSSKAENAEVDDLDDFFNDVEEATEEVVKAKEEEAAEGPRATNAIKSHKKDLGTAESQIQRLLQPNYKWRNLNPFYVLDVPPTATEEEISRRYKALALLLHPDKNRSHEQAQDAYDQVQKAKTMLLDDENKAKHCRDLAEQGMRQGKREWEQSGRQGDLEDLQFRAVQKIFAQIEHKRQEVDRRERNQEQRERQQEEEELNKERNAMKFEKQWREESRVDKRIGNWRDFQKKKKSKSG